MQKRYNPRRVILHAVEYCVLILIALVMLFPILWIASSSLKTTIDLSSYPPKLFPAHPVFSNYLRVFEGTNVLRYTLNTLVLIVGNTLGTLLSSPIVAYPLARMKFKGQHFIFMLIIATMMVPTTTVIIPQYLLFSKIGWLDSFLPLIVPSFFAYPYNVFLFRQFFKTIPASMDEAAMIDGCNRLKILTHILIPLSKPTFITIGVLCAVSWWNELFTPLIYINTDNLKPLTVGALTVFKTGGGFITEWNLTMAMSIVMIVPPILLYLFASKYIVTGIKTSGVKG